MFVTGVTRFQRFGVKMDFGSLFGGIGSLATGLLNYSSQQTANQQNMMMNTGAWKGQQVAAEANALGVSPLAILGNTGSNIPFQSVQAPDLSGLGQGIGRAVSANSTKDDELDKLTKQNLTLKNMQLENDVAAGQFLNAHRAVSLGQPATPMPRPVPGDTAPNPYQGFSGREIGTRDKPYPMYEWAQDPDGGPPVKVISDKYAHTQFGPTAYYTGLMSMPGMIGGWANDMLDWTQSKGREYGTMLRSDINRRLTRFAPVDPMN